MFESFVNGAVFVAVLVGLGFVAVRAVSAYKSKNTGKGGFEKQDPPQQGR